MNFSEALTALKEGKYVYRLSWIAKDSSVPVMYIAGVMLKKELRLLRISLQGNQVNNYVPLPGNTNDPVEDVMAEDWKIMND